MKIVLTLTLTCILIVSITSAKCQRVDSSFIDKAVKRYNQFTDSSFYDFALLDNHDQIIKLSDFRNKLVLIHFWFTNCGPCVGLIPYDKKLYQKLLKQYTDVVWINISVDIDTAHWKRFIKANDLPGIHLISPGFAFSDSTNASKLLHVKAYPTYILINKNGQIIGHNVSKPQEANGTLLEYFIFRGREGVSSGDAIKEMMAGTAISRAFFEKNRTKN